jgi:hypothetical protein
MRMIRDLALDLGEFQLNWELAKKTALPAVPQSRFPPKRTGGTLAGRRTLSPNGRATAMRERNMESTRADITRRGLRFLD